MSQVALPGNMTMTSPGTRRRDETALHQTNALKRSCMHLSVTPMPRGHVWAVSES